MVRSSRVREFEGIVCGQGVESCKIVFLGGTYYSLPETNNNNNNNNNNK